MKFKTKRTNLGELNSVLVKLVDEKLDATIAATMVLVENMHAVSMRMLTVYLVGHKLTFAEIFERKKKLSMPMS